jgi:cell division septal protein FtsQ
VKRVIFKPFLAILTAIVVALAYILGWSQFFVVKDIQVLGSPNRISEANIVRLSEVIPGGQLARINIRSTEEKIGEITWVKDVKISRNWINGKVVLEISVRKPIAYFNTDQKVGQTIDSEGELFVLPGFASSELPQISAISPDGALAANALFTAFPTDFRGSITSMVAASSRTFVVNSRLKGRDIQIRWGDSSEMNLKIAVINRLLALPENKKITVIDLLAPHAPIVR